MSAVHDFAIVQAPAPEHGLEPGDRIEVVGYVWCDYYLGVVYRDQKGHLDTLPANALRLQPWVEDKP